jgi:hypothetical protein
MSLIDRARVRLAAWWYGFWLEFHSIPGRRRRELKRELRVNLVDAAAASSARRAIQDLDGLRALAGAVARDGIARPRWQTAGVAAAVTFGVIVNVEFIAALNWVSGVVDGGERAATGVVFPFPGSVVTYEPPGYGMVLEPGWLPFIGPLLIFVLLARPWRLLRRSSGSPLVGLRHD